MKVLFSTLGCKVNQYETESLRERFEASGYSCAAEDETADIVVINSCTVTAESDRKTRQLCRKYRKLMPEAVIILIGCMAQAFPEEAAALDSVDIVLGNRDPALVISSVERFLSSRCRIVEVSPHERKAKFNTPAISDFEERTRAFMKIEDGCERYCTYCIIPTARGAVRSRDVEDIRNEAVRLAANGFKEIVLVGINLSSYGKDNGSSLSEAVSAVCSAEGIERVRLGSLEPDLMTDAELEKLAAEKKFCPQFHLALQSGCDRTLKTMNRHYDTAFFSDLVERIRKVFINSSITTDIMVGFAGETEEDFEKSVAYVGEIGFARCHVFAYSRREGTRAAKMPEQIANAEKSRRAHIMGEAASNAMRKFHETQIGMVCNVLFEHMHDGIASGYTENYTHVIIAGSKDYCGRILKVKITGIIGDDCTGELV